MRRANDGNTPPKPLPPMPPPSPMPLPLPTLPPPMPPPTCSSTDASSSTDAGLFTGNLRARVVRFLAAAAGRLKLNAHALHVAVNTVHRYLIIKPDFIKPSHRGVRQNHWLTLISAAALWIAVKLAGCIVGHMALVLRHVTM